MNILNMPIEKETIFIIFLIAIFLYLRFGKRAVHPSSILLSTSESKLFSPHVPIIPSDRVDKHYLGVAPLQRYHSRVHPIVTDAALLESQEKDVMRDQKAIDGIAPYNPDIMGKEWDVPILDIKDITPIPHMVPFPTMNPPPSIISTFQHSSLDVEMIKGHLDESYSRIDNLGTSIDSQMSKWTQFGPCVENTQSRTRTCIHGGIDGGSPCSETVQHRKC